MSNFNIGTYRQSSTPAGEVVPVEELKLYYPISFGYEVSKTQKGFEMKKPYILCQRSSHALLINEVNKNGNYVNGSSVPGNEIKIELPHIFYDLTLHLNEAFIQKSNEEKLSMAIDTSTKFAHISDMIMHGSDAIKQIKDAANKFLADLGILGNDRFTAIKAPHPNNPQDLGSPAYQQLSAAIAPTMQSVVARSIGTIIEQGIVWGPNGKVMKQERDYNGSKYTIYKVNV